MLSLHCQYVGGQRLTVKEFLPLVGQNASGGPQCSFDQSHNICSFLISDGMTLCAFPPGGDRAEFHYCYYTKLFAVTQLPAWRNQYFSEIYFPAACPCAGQILLI